MTEEKADTTTPGSQAWDLTQIIAGGTAAAFALSCANLLGTFTALDSGIFRFLTVQDVLSNAIWIAPIMFVGLALRIMSEFIAGSSASKEVSPAKFLRALWLVTIYSAVGGIVFWTFPPWSMLILLILLFLAYRSVLVVLKFKSAIGTIDNSALYLADIIFLLIAVLMLAYYSTVMDMLARPPTHKVCVSDSCREASVFDEISAGLVLRWKDEDVLTLVPTTKIDSVSALYPRSMSPVYDIFGFGDGETTKEEPPAKPQAKPAQPDSKSAD